MLSGASSRLVAALLVLQICLISLTIGVFREEPKADALSVSEGDALLTWGGLDGTPSQRFGRIREYFGASSTFSSSFTPPGSTTAITQVRSSPLRQEAIAAFLEDSGTLNVLCYNGASWSSEWTYSIGTADTRRFDIAFEETSGDAMVLYSTGASTVNQLQYRTKPGSLGCGSSNWTSGVNMTTQRTTKRVDWVKLAWDKRPGTDRLAAAWSTVEDGTIDGYEKATLSVRPWNGSAWESEPAVALENQLDYYNAAGRAAPFELEFEALSGDLMVLASYVRGTLGNTLFYSRCTGASVNGVTPCSWTTVRQAVQGSLADGVYLALAADPISNDLAFGSVGSANEVLQLGRWNGSTWSTRSYGSNSACIPGDYADPVSIQWRTNGSTNRILMSYVGYDQCSSGSRGLRILSANPSSLPSSLSGATSLRPDYQSDLLNYIEMEANPVDRTRSMLLTVDASKKMSVYEMTLSSSGTVAFTNRGGALENSITRARMYSAAFAYWRAPTPMFLQTGYRWYENSATATPGPGLASAGESASVAQSALRLRMKLDVSVGTMPAASTQFLLQTSTDQANWVSVSAHPGLAGQWTFLDNSGLSSGTSISPLLSTVGQSYEEKALTTINLRQTNVGESLEFDFALDGSRAPNGTSYFRLALSDGSALVAYSSIPTITLRPDLKILSYRVFEDSTTGAIAASKALMDSAPIVGTGENFRLRAAIKSSGRNFAPSDVSFKLQYAKRDGTCDPGGSGESWADVTNISPVRFSTTAPADATTVVANAALDPGLGTAAPQFVLKANPTTARTAISAESAGLWDFALQNHSGESGGYCFQLAGVGNSNVLLPDVVPEVRVNSAPNAPSELVQLHEPGLVLETGAWKAGNQVWFSAQVTDSDVGDSVRLCVEVKPVGVGLTGTPSSCASTGTSVAAEPVTLLHSMSIPEGGRYHWAAQVVDSFGDTSPWRYYSPGSETTNDSNAMDFGLDNAAPVVGAVFDGTIVGVDSDQNDGSLDSLSANWQVFADQHSGGVTYEYGIGTTPGSVNIVGWTSHGTSQNVTRSGLSLQTGQRYYFAVRATDAVGNVSEIAHSDGQFVSPTLAFSANKNLLDFGILSGTDTPSSQSVELTTSTNARNGFRTFLQSTSSMQSTSGAILPVWPGTGLSPTSWTSGIGIGYTSSDLLVGGTNRFGSGTLYAGLPAVGSPDLVCDATGPVVSQNDTLTLKLVVPPTQAAGNYVAVLTLTVIAEY